jgi:hypothetical protein
VTTVKAAARRVFAAFIAPRTQFLLNVVLTGVWAVLMVPALLWWRESVPFLVICSVYANLAGHFAGIAGAVAARKVDPDDPL